MHFFNECGNRGTAMVAGIRIALGLWMLVCGTAYAADDSGEREDYNKLPVEKVRPYAIKGDLGAIHALCYRYIYGDKAPLDYAEAHNWCAQGAVRGGASSQTLLAELFLLGKGGPAKPERAYHWYLEAADQDHVHALFMLYLMDANGLSPKKDPERAMRYLRRSAELGYQAAIDMLKSLEEEAKPGKSLRKTAGESNSRMPSGAEPAQASNTRQSRAG
nr:MULTISPECIES: tetratricopeptide repeat protein [unclassified Pseudoxanthomonas]